MPVDGDIVGNDTGTNSPLDVASKGRDLRAKCRQRCTTLAMMPCDIPTLATEAPRG